MAIAKGLWFSSQSEFDSGKQHRYYIRKPFETLKHLPL